MKKFVALVAVLLVTALLTSCSSGPQVPYTITAEFVVVENQEPEEAAADASSTDELDTRLDPASVTVMVSYETTNEDGDTETVVLASGNFSESSLEFTGVVDKPTTVEITVDIGEDEPLTAAAVLSPGSKTRFAVLDYLGSYPDDTLAMIGSSHMSKDPRKKFSIAGDFGSFDGDLAHAVLDASITQYDDAGETESRYLGVVWLENGRFLIEADIEEPARVTVFFESAPDWKSYSAWTNYVIVEPGAEITVSVRDEAQQLLATSGVGMHATLVESWQQTDEYLSTFDKHNEAYTQYMADWEAQTEAVQADSDESESAGEDAVAEEEIASEPSEAEGDEQTDSGIAEESSAIASAEPATPVAEGCEHVTVASEPTSSFESADASDLPEYSRLQQLLDRIKSNALQTIATDSNNPFESFLAMELGAFSDGAENRSDALPVYDRLVTLFDADRYVKRISKARDRVVWRIESEENDESLVRGQKAPQFTLASLEGTEVALYDVLDEQELVLIDFWASWCGPCIADFPELKKLYSAYKGLGFEIVGVSIDDSFEDWEGGSLDNELPWVDLGEMAGWRGATARSYGVLAIPKGYLLDSDGCILERNIRPAMLEEVLVARFGEMPELKESSTESESEPMDPSSDEIGASNSTRDSST